MYSLSHRQRTYLFVAIVAIVLIFIGIAKTSPSMRFADGDRVDSFGGGYSLGYDTAAQNGVMEEKSRIMFPEPMPPAAGTAAIEDVTRDERLIIRTAYVSAITDNVQTAVAALEQKVKADGGFVVQSSISGLELRPSASLTVRVPVATLDTFLAMLRTTYRVVSENVSGEDVTEQYVDNEARLKTLEASEAQFLAIMNNATKIEDVLNVQQQLERVRGEIESLKGRQQYLDRSAKLSTVTIQLATEETELPIVNPAEPWSPLATFREAIRSFLELLKSAADLVILLSPYLLVGAIIFLATKVMQWRKKTMTGGKKS